MPVKSILHNIRILDFTWVLAGPYATRLLADFGAEVIKVQPLLSSEADDTLAQGYYATWNRNKLGVTLNLNKPEGIAIVKRLVGVCDAVIENFTPRVMANWGLDYRSLKKLKPDIIMVSMSAMGQKGKGRNYTGFAPTVHALSGMTHLTSFPGKQPSGPGFAYADHIAGLYASITLLGALEQRRQTGKGQHIDISEVKAIKSLMGGGIQKKDTPMEPAGNRSPLAAPHNVYKCKGENRWCAITVYTEGEWCALKKAMGNPAWAEENKFSTQEGRKDNETELDKRITAWTRKYTAGELDKILQGQGIASGTVQDAFDIFIDPQLKSRNFFIKAPDGEFGLTDANPIRMNDAGARYKNVAPAPGQDNDYVYGKLLFMTRKEIETLRKKGVI
jgi:crotonobetainyl-CoA:carnitine CoA-transferase CaiB-like acyl-CoA transferase